MEGHLGHCLASDKRGRRCQATRAAIKGSDTQAFTIVEGKTKVTMVLLSCVNCLGAALATSSQRVGITRIGSGEERWGMRGGGGG